MCIRDRPSGEDAVAVVQILRLGWGGDRGTRVHGHSPALGRSEARLMIAAAGLGTGTAAALSAVELLLGSGMAKTPWKKIRFPYK